MKLQNNDYTLNFENGGLLVTRNEKVLYTNDKPIYIFVLDYLCMAMFYDAPYETVKEENGKILAAGTLISGQGSVFSVTDEYTCSNEGFAVSRKVTVVKKAEDELERGFASKFTLRPTLSSNTHDFNYFSPGVWYRQNEHVPAHFMGADLDAEYFHWQETRCALPMFAMQHIESGESVSLSRYASDVRLRNMNRDPYNNYVDPTYDIGAVGMSQPQNSCVYYDDLNTTITRVPLPRNNDPLGIDYVYPADNGETDKRMVHGIEMNPARRVIKRLDRVFHPVEEGFSDAYRVQMDFGCFKDFNVMMKVFFRQTNKRLQAPVADTDCELLFVNSLKLLKIKTRKFNNSYGIPFLSYLPEAQDQNVDYQYGFVGQQPGIGYQLMRYAMQYNDPEAYEKGHAVVDFWCRRGSSELGAPLIWFNPPLDEFQYEPYWIRMLGDGLENVLDAYMLIKDGSDCPFVEKGEDLTHWFLYLKRAADWLVKIQNEDGSYYRSYDAEGRMCMDSKANTIAIVRFLIRFYLLTGEEAYKNAAHRAGEWCYEHTYKETEYRGGTCDNSDVQDKESAIYAVFGFLALYDFEKDPRWLEAAQGAADYVITWTYMWAYPIITRHEIHPFNTRDISGQSLIASGHSATDVYMAACSYVFYRIYLYTDDPEYLNFARFLSKNPQQCNDVDGSIGYAIPGLNHEACFFYDQVLNSQYHWLPWCTYVVVDPLSCMADTFGTYEIDEAEKLPLEERKCMNERVLEKYKK